MFNVLSLKLGSNPESAGVIRELRKLQPDLRVFGVGEFLDEDVAEFDVTVTSHYDALFGRYLKYPLASVAMTPELYALVAPFEGRVMAMLERIALNPLENYPSPREGNPPYEDTFEARANLFYRHCRFWHHIFERFKIDAVISQNFGHQGYDEVAISLAQALEIPTLIFNDSTTLQFVQFVQENVASLGDLSFGKALKTSIQNSLEPESSNFISRHLTQATLTPDRFGTAPRDFATSIFSGWLVDNNVRVDGRLTPSLLVKGISRKLRRFIQSPWNSPRRLIRKIPRYLATARAKREETRVVKSPPAEKYVYFPLHFQPEASTAVKGRHFYRQREAVSFIASELPAGYILVVKEHPHQIRRHYPRAPGFFTQLAAIPRVCVVHHSMDNKLLLDNCAAVCAISHSSVSTHALFDGTPVLSLGYSVFREAPNYFVIGSRSELRNAFRIIASRTSDHVDIGAFIQRLEESTFEAVLGYRPGDVSETEYRRLLSVTSKNISQVISSWLSLRIGSSQVASAPRR